MKSPAPLLSFAGLPQESRCSPILRALITVAGTGSGVIWSIVLGSPLPLLAFATLSLFAARLATLLSTPPAVPRHTAFLNVCTHRRAPSRRMRLLAH